MNFKDVTNDLANQKNYRLQQRLERLMRVNPSFKNLDSENKELILKLIKKYKNKIRQGIKPSRLTVRRDKYYLYQHRIKLGLSFTDLEQINNLLDGFKH